MILRRRNCIGRSAVCPEMQQRSRFSDFDAALDEVNESVFGLQAGIFTRDIYRAHRAWEVLEREMKA